MEERENLTQDDVLDLIGGDGFPEQPMFNKVVITLNTEEVDGGMILSDNVLSDAQYVVAVGESARVSAGQKVRIDIEKLMIPIGSASTDAYEPKMQIKFDPIEVNGKQFAIIEDRFIKTKINY